MENNERTINVTVYCEPKSKYINSELPKETVEIIESYCTDECKEMTVTLKEDGTIAYINLLKKGYNRSFIIYGKGLPQMNGIEYDPDPEPQNFNEFIENVKVDNGGKKLIDYKIPQMCFNNKGEK